MAKKHLAKYDWPALKLEWLKTDLNLNQFRATKGIDPAHFYRCINSTEWIEARETIYKKALIKYQEKSSTSIANKWADYSKLWGAVKGQAAAILRKTQGQDGKVRPMAASQLAQLTQAIETALKSERLISEQSTENVSHNVNVHQFILDSMEKDKDGNRPNPQSE